MEDTYKILMEELRSQLRFARAFYLTVIAVLIAVIGVLCWGYLQDTQDMDTYIGTLREAYEQCKNQIR